MAQGTFESHVFEPADILQNLSLVSLVSLVSVCRAVVSRCMKRQ